MSLLSKYDSALHVAVIDHDANALRILLRAGGNVRTKAHCYSGSTTLVEPIDCLWCVDGVAYSQDTLLAALECLDVLVEHGATARTPCNTLRELIFDKAPVPLIAALVENLDCDINSRRFGSTILMETLRMESANVEQITRILLRAGADPNIPIVPPRSRSFVIARYPLHEAASNCTIDVVRLLMDFGADPYQVDDITGMRAIDWARHGRAAFPNANVCYVYKFLEALDDCRQFRLRVWPDLQKELMESAWHPMRLLKQGYFQFLDAEAP